MSDIETLQTRLTSALARIRDGVAGLETRLAEHPAPLQADPEAIEAAEAARAAASAALEDERVANAQLQERVKRLNARIEELEADHEQHSAQDAARAERAATLDSALQQLQQSNSALRDMNSRLRAALSQTLDTQTAQAPELINRAMQAELDALDAAHRAQSAEIAALLAELDPLLTKEAS